MGEYCVVTDITSDLSVDMIEKLGIYVLPMAFDLDEKNYMQYPDEREMKLKNFYDHLREGETATTSQVTYNTFMESFEPLLKKGNDILYIAFSSGLSGTFNASLIAAEDLMEKYPDRKIMCIDSLCASGGEGLMVYTAVQKKMEGMPLEQLSEWLINNRLKLCLWFTVDDLGHLKRGGRVSTLASVVGTVLGVKPILHVDNEGHLIPMSKVRGRKKSLEALLEQMEKTCVNPEEQVVFINHGDSLEDAQFLAQMIQEKLKVKDVVISYIGAVVGSHSGPGTIALFFYGAER